MFEYYGNIHVYCPGVGAYEALGSNFFSESLIFSPTAHFLQDFYFNLLHAVGDCGCPWNTYLCQLEATAVDKKNRFQISRTFRPLPTYEY